MANQQPLSIVFTPEYGVCLDSVTLEANRCVISAASCESGKEVYRAPYEIDQSCNSPDDVVVGRCSSSLDDNRCGSSAVSCGTKSSFFEPFDPTCSLSVDSNTSNNNTKELRTTFPACRNPDTNSWLCSFDQQYCLSQERLTYAKWAAEWGSKPCHCEDVPTGICYQTKNTANNDNLTPANSFCAVSPGDCPSTHGFMSARAFLESERATFQCRFCEDPKDDYSDSYPAGACQQKDGSLPSSYVSCAMESDDCPSETTQFISSQRLSQEGLRCPAELTRNWGECKSMLDLVECTNKGESCLYAFRFEVNDSDCSMYRNSKTSLPTYFSYCAPRTDNDNRDWRDIRCVWDKEECDPSRERWEESRLPNNAWFRGCLCEDVFTGVCQESSTGEYHCAVSAKACTDPSSYIPQRLLKERKIDMSCPLCSSRQSHTSPDATSLPTIAPSQPTSPEVLPAGTTRPAFVVSPMPTYSTFSAPTRPPIPPTPISTSATANNFGLDTRKNLASGLIAGITVLVILALAIVSVTVYVEKRQRARRRGHSPDDSIPAEEVIHTANNNTTDTRTSIEVDHNQDLVTPSVQIT